jgi:hypothetical protein
MVPWVQTANVSVWGPILFRTHVHTPDPRGVRISGRDESWMVALTNGWTRRTRTDRSNGDMLKDAPHTRVDVHSLSVIVVAHGNASNCASVQYSIDRYSPVNGELLSGGG